MIAGMFHTVFLSPEVMRSPWLFCIAAWMYAFPKECVAGSCYAYSILAWPPSHAVKLIIWGSSPFGVKLKGGMLGSVLFQEEDLHSHVPIFELSETRLIFCVQFWKPRFQVISNRVRLLFFCLFISALATESKCYWFYFILFYFLTSLFRHCIDQWS